MGTGSCRGPSPRRSPSRGRSGPGGGTQEPADELGGFVPRLELHCQARRGAARLHAGEQTQRVGAPDTGNTIKLFVTELRKDGTTSKTLLLNLDVLGIPLDNVEGMAFGPRLRGGKRSLLFVSDNNFAATQFTQFLLFAVGTGHHDDDDDDDD